MIATTKEQSARLLKCGVPADSADMHFDMDEKRYKGWRFTGTLLKLRKCPAWSLCRLLELIPKVIDIDGYPYRIGIYFENPDEPVIGNQWCLFYKPTKNTEKSHYIDDVPMYAPGLIECAVLMVEWLTRHNYKLNEI